MIDYNEELLLNYDENIEKWCQNKKVPLMIIGDTIYISFGNYLRYKKAKDNESQ